MQWGAGGSDGESLVEEGGVAEFLGEALTPDSPDLQKLMPPPVPSPRHAGSRLRHCALDSAVCTAPEERSCRGARE